MAAADGGVQVGDDEVRVALGGVDGAVAEEELHGADACAPTEKMGGVAVAQHVGRDGARERAVRPVSTSP